MPLIEPGSAVKINYTLTVSGEVVDSSAEGGPLSYVQGSGEIVPGLERALTGLGVGAKKKVVVSPADGYGEADPEAFKKVPKQTFDDLEGLAVGSMVAGQAGGREFKAVVAEVGESEVTLNLNHPLAGKTLEFEIEVVEVRAPR